MIVTKLDRLKCKLFGHKLLKRLPIWLTDYKYKFCTRCRKETDIPNDYDDFKM